MLEAEGLTCSKGTRLLFEDVSFQLRAGQLLRVTAPNGHGKTSLLRILCGLARADAGTVCWRGADIHRLGPGYRQHLLYLGHADALADSLTPSRTCASCARPRPMPSARQPVATPSAGWTWRRCWTCRRVCCRAASGAA